VVQALIRIILKVWSVANGFFCLTRREYVHEKDSQTGQGQLVCIEQRINNPDALIVLFFLLFAVVYYGVFSLPLTLMMSGGWTLAHWPALVVLALNSTYRLVLKWHERIGAILEWEHPVGRESNSTRVVAVLIGFTAGFGSGLLADWLVNGGQLTDTGIGIAALVGVAESVWNGKRIGGGKMYDEIESPEIEERRIVISQGSF
jgi:hypothetical protein